MALRLPFFLKLTRAALDRRDAFFASILRAARVGAADASLAVRSFAFKNDEHGFARALLARRSEVWLFRANQRAFCGDFLMVDMSSPDAARRGAFVLELKLGAPLREGSGGVQLRNAERAVCEVAHVHGVLCPEAPFTVITGGGAEMLERFAR